MPTTKRSAFLHVERGAVPLYHAVASLPNHLDVSEPLLQEAIQALRRPNEREQGQEGCLVARPGFSRLGCERIRQDVRLLLEVYSLGRELETYLI